MIGYPSGQDGAGQDKNFFESHIINPILTKLIWLRLLDIGLILFLQVYHFKHAEKKRTWPISNHLDQTSLVNNSYIIFQTQCLICIKTCKLYIFYLFSVTDPVISCVYSIDRGCKGDCDLITLGSYKTVDNYELNGAKDTVSHTYFKV